MLMHFSQHYLIELDGECVIIVSLASFGLFFLVLQKHLNWW